MIETNNGVPRVCVGSEIGRLRAVLLHRPGVEITRMTPENAAEALYSDILNKPIVDREYAEFSGVLEKWTKVYYVEDVLATVLENNAVRKALVEESCRLDGCQQLTAELMGHDPRRLAKELIEGVERKAWTPDQADRYELKPLYNLFFTRDASSSVYDRVLINSMSFPVRRREILIYRAVFENYFGCETFNAEQHDAEARTEGGDVQIAREDMLCIGEGIRTNRKGIEYLAREMASRHGKFNILVQQLPHKPESFIHLDMVFTFLDRDACACYLPLIAKESRYRTTVITIDGGQVSYREEPTLLQALKKLRFDLEPISCGAPDDEWNQQREQWHSGANFVALEPGKVIGYARNTRTIDQLNRHGFDVVPAADVASGKVTLDSHKRCVVTLRSDELPRGGGGGRCMTMPVNRENVIW